jgi:hypothetical protein
MSLITKSLIIGSALLACALGAGCGGGDESTSTSAAEFTQQADAVCKRVGTERIAAFQKLEQSGTRPEDLDPAALQKVNDEIVVDPLREVANELSELSIPSEGSAEYERVVEGYENLLGQVEGSEANLLLSQPPEFKRELEEVRKSAKKAGLKICAQI